MRSLFAHELQSTTIPNPLYVRRWLSLSLVGGGGLGWSATLTIYPYEFTPGRHASEVE